MEAAPVARGEPGIDADKVERLCSTIEAGMWRADSQVIAERMLEDASDDPSASRPAAESAGGDAAR